MLASGKKEPRNRLNNRCSYIASHGFIPRCVCSACSIDRGGVRPPSLSPPCTMLGRLLRTSRGVERRVGERDKESFQEAGSEVCCYSDIVWESHHPDKNPDPDARTMFEKIANGEPPEGGGGGGGKFGGQLNIRVG